MRIRRFTAPDVNSAMGMVKKALGPEAVILARRDLATAKGAVAIEITAAVDRDGEGEREEKAGARYTSAGRLEPKVGDRAGAFVTDLAWEVAELRRAVRQMAGGKRRRNIAKLGRCWVDLYDRLCARGVLPNVAFDLVMRSALERRTDGLQPGEKLALGIGKALPVGDGLGRITVAVGPTGSGKTTTIAKLAVRLGAGRRVGLVMADAFRLGATEQLEGYARLLGLPMEVATNGADLSRAIARLSDRDAILIDTAGQSGRGPEEEVLGEMLQALPARGRTVAWVISATAETRILDRAWRWNVGVGPDLCIATKLDEAGGLAQVYNWLWEARIPLGYLATGQKVPDDLERATGPGVGRWLLGGTGVSLDCER